MKSGYKILWTDFALKELENTVEYLKENWTEKELHNLASKLEETLSIIAQNPKLFPESDIKKDVYRVVVLKYNTLYYRLIRDQIEIISFFSNRQNPKKRKIS